MKNLNLIFAATVQHYFDLGEPFYADAVSRFKRRPPTLPEFVLNRKSTQGYSFISGRNVIVPMGVKCEPATNLPQGGYWITGDWCSIATHKDSEEITSWRDTYGFWVSNEYVTKL